jgi:hypothetical protein
MAAASMPFLLRFKEQGLIAKDLLYISILWSTLELRELARFLGF